MSTDDTPPGGVLVIGASLEAERVVHLVRRLPDPLEILGLIAIDPATERAAQERALDALMRQIAASRSGSSG